MLLRNIAPDSHDDIFTAMSTSTPTRRTPTPPPPQTYHSDDIPTNNHLDDVWGDNGDNDNLNHPTITPIPEGSHPSDMPRLRQEHTTAGYRDGITVAKAKSVQAGFDEGFGLGATIGLRAGELVGILEGLVGALSSSSSPSSSVVSGVERVKGLWEEAKRELGVQVVFGKDYWEEDGTWKYEVAHPEGEAGTVFGDVAMAHPLLVKWDGIVRGEAERYGVDWDVLKEEAEEERTREEGHDHGHAHEKKGEATLLEKGKGALEW
ncbi:hypothetical protein B0T14DRAFT_560151 [Immersiella caudata]|uniref:Protein YAE1 n=1 Tax=Immersiella caudata TaxID=314043 RepID=A0AA39XG09_9PEZI|nr:hypothetical protein B0T14DRAFT_560151 [Immersiella caudata]